MSVRILREVWEYAPDFLNTSQQLVLLALAYEARDDDRIAGFSSANQISQKCRGLSASSVRRILAELVGHGLISREVSRANIHRAQRYHIQQLHAYHRALTHRITEHQDTLDGHL